MTLSIRIRFEPGSEEKPRRWEYRLTGAPWLNALDLLVTTARLNGELLQDGGEPAIWRRLYGQENHLVHSEEENLVEVRGFYSLVTLLSERLDALESKLQTEAAPRRAIFWQSLSDGHLKESGFKSLIGSDTASRPHPEEKAAAYLAIYKALAQFLAAGDRFRTLDARLALCYATWQWFHLAKWLSVQPWNFRQVNQSDSYISRLMRSEIAESHRLLVEMIYSQEFTSALRAMYNAMYDKPLLSVPLLREQMRLSLPLIPVISMKQGPAPDPLENNPIPGMACASQVEPAKPLSWLNFKTMWRMGRVPLVNWENAILHPDFQTRPTETGGKRATRKLVTEWLLARYDLDNALHIARLMKDNRTNQHVKGRLGLFSFIVLMALLLLSHWFVPFESPVAMKLLLSIFEWTALLGLGVSVASKVEHSVIPYLAMPRAVGGILVGYLALLLQEDSLNLSRFFFERADLLVVILAVVFLYVTVWALGMFYLYYDTLPLVGLPEVALRRATLTIWLAFRLSAFLGLFLVAIASKMYPTPSNWLLFGPVGWIDWQMYVLFVPVALFTGLVTQFIFEEKTVTASVWSPE